MNEIVLPPAADMKAATGGDVCEWDAQWRRDAETATHRMFLFILTVLPAALGLVAWCDTV